MGGGCLPEGVTMHYHSTDDTFQRLHSAVASFNRAQMSATQLRDALMKLSNSTRLSAAACLILAEQMQRVIDAQGPLTNDDLISVKAVYHRKPVEQITHGPVRNRKKGKTARW
jgi:hypothetical protein